MRHSRIPAEKSSCRVAWRPVNTDGEYSLQTDNANEVRFTPVKTTAVRLEIETSDAPCGIQEWSMN